MYKIYLITNVINGKMYVGQTCQEIKTRWSHHKGDANRGSSRYFARAIYKHGDDKFVVESISLCISKRVADILEKFWISKLKTNLASHGYNLTLGGEGACGTNVSLKTRFKMSQSRVGKVQSEETITKRVAYHLGAKRSEETKEKIRDAWKIRRQTPMSEETRRKLSEAGLLRWQRERDKNGS